MIRRLNRRVSRYEVDNIAKAYLGRVNEQAVWRRLPGFWQVYEMTFTACEDDKDAFQLEFDIRETPTPPEGVTMKVWMNRYGIVNFAFLFQSTEVLNPKTKANSESPAPVLTEEIKLKED